VVLFLQVSVIGAGSWGTVLAQILSDNGHIVTLWARNANKAEKIASSRCNVDYLPSLILAPTITITNDLETAIKRAEVLVFVVPSGSMKDICEQVVYIDDCSRKIILSCTKGFDTKLGLRMSQIIAAYLPKALAIAVLSGPNLAGELANRQPGATVIACRELAIARYLQDMFINNYFRPYISEDVDGIEICGCLKNTMALVSGMMFGMKFGENCQAALITRGLAEITRLGMKLGAHQDTFYGLAGIGDLVATCTSTQSRNRRAGEALAQGKTLKEIYTATNMVIEGINTTKVVYSVAEEQNVEMPIVTQLYLVLFKEKSVHDALDYLMSRKGKKE
jgi:glycerol-3-phosphate dehydrogenase (NAD(P)+)